jgi:glycosyltransferase involved in cell wall biosynthesis
MSDSDKWVLQLCHSYGAPFDDVARQWKVLFDDTPYKVLTVFLTGAPNDNVVKLVGGDVIFLGYKSKDIRGLKRKQINDIGTLNNEYQFTLAIAHRYKPIYITTHVKGLRVFGVAHAYGVFDGFWRKKYVQRCKERLTLIGVSNAIRDDVKAALPKYPQEKIQTIYNRVNVKRLQDGQVEKEQARQYLGLSADAYIVGNVGRLHPDKDQKTLIAGFAEALPNLNNGLLVIVGDGRLETELRQQVSDLDITKNVLFLGRVPDAWKYFKAFDVFALTSNYEPFGMVLLEAMVANIPVVSSNVGGAPEVLGGTGVLFPLGDSAELAKAFEVLFLEDCNDSGGLSHVENMFDDAAVKAMFFNTLSSEFS